MKLVIATCQFPVDEDINRNTRYVIQQMRQAKEKGAAVVHFSEVCLSGYAGSEFKSYDKFNWDLLYSCSEQVLNFARELKMWVILGSSHRLSGKHKPHNSLYIINNHGRIVDRYDKLFCVGDKSESTDDLAHYSPGSHFSVFTINGVKCGALICHDFRYQELYREYKRKGVKLMFHSFHVGNYGTRKWRKTLNYLVPRVRKVKGFISTSGVLTPPTMQTYAANNYMWVSSNNTSARESAFPSFFVRADGLITGMLPRNKAGVLISTVDTKLKMFDASEHWRDRVIHQGILHSGKIIKDKRSNDRKHF